MDQKIETEGTVTAVLAGTMFRVQLNRQQQVLAHSSGRMRRRFIHLTVGDRVRMHMSPYDLSCGRIVFRVGRADSPDLWHLKSICSAA